MQSEYIEDGLDKLEINTYVYKYEPISTRRETASKSLELPSKPKFPIIYLLIFISFIVGFNFGVDQLDVFDVENIAAKESESTISDEEKVYKKQSLIELMGELSKQKSIQEKSLKQLFGKYQFNIIFENPLIMDKIFVMEPLSKERLIRRLMIKILQAQVSDGNSQNIYEDTNNLYTSSTFVWATGGDSAAAGHGNLFQQSYTPILEETVKGAFRALGVQFQGRNYAMGGYTSAPELALCMEAIYGNDLDILAWDFSMTEEVYTHWHGDEGFTNSEDKEDMSYKVSLWGHRAGIHPTKPILFMMDSSKKSNRWGKFSSLVERGMGSILMDSEGMSELMQILPITKTINPTNEDIEYRESLPPLLQYLRCDDGSIEGSVPCNDPMNYMYCMDESKSVCWNHKYNTQEACSDARNQRPYNPGW